ncbi:hypothetical protein BDV95DRAFT_614758 [Massariosphaeria phaeospora]|uniref:SnoaL-like domain-containing protein n=1 Tax=Massariosphaeria phaeospora TaxID=100035 RepID=A0A7C8IEU7_9PLEO|nr:hypothetical protein BDV95DRAFT_614758 [Massariosphaeria phaeospora]
MANLATVALATLAILLPSIYFLVSERTRPTRMSAPAPTPHIATFHAFLRAYSTLSPATLTANASPAFTHSVLPSSLGLPARTLDPFKQHAGMILSLFSSFSMTPQPSPSAVHYSRDTNTVVAHCKMGGVINGESEQGKKLVDSGVSEWWTECVMFVRMDEGGREVVEVREFVHSAKAEELKRRMMGLLES